MTLEATIEQDLKTALLSRDEQTVNTLRLLKSAILNEKVAKGTRGADLDDKVVVELLAKEAKKRQESADLYKQGGNTEKAETELQEKAIIERYLPAQLSEAEIKTHVETVITEMDAHDMSKMGQVIAAVRERTNGAADGGTIARLVKERLSS